MSPTLPQLSSFSSFSSFCSLSCAPAPPRSLAPFLKAFFAFLVTDFRALSAAEISWDSSREPSGWIHGGVENMCGKSLKVFPMEIKRTHSELRLCCFNQKAIVLDIDDDTRSTKQFLWSPLPSFLVIQLSLLSRKQRSCIFVGVSPLTIPWFLSRIVALVTWQTHLSPGRNPYHIGFCPI